MTKNNNNWDDCYDVVVVGSGAGAMTASLRVHDLGMKVVVVEKSDQYGGTSAVSGGGIWIPNNHRIAALGGQDSDAEAIHYINEVTGGSITDGRIEAYVGNARKMVDYLEASSHARFDAQAEYADYYPEVEGGKPGFRSMDPLPFDARKLGEEFYRMREPSPGTLMFGRIAMTMKEARVLLCRGPGWVGLTNKIMWRYYKDLRGRVKSKRDRFLTLGNALVAALRRSMMDRNIPLWLNTPMAKLIEDQGRVVGVEVTKNGRSFRIKANRGVILGAGGFERNQEMRKKYHPQPSNAAWSAAPPTNTGDAIRAGQGLGAATALMEHSWWAPTTHVEGEEKQRAIFIERALPGCIMVNQVGQRFVNEAAPYNDIGYAMYEAHSDKVCAVPCWMVFDAEFRRKYPVGALLPGYAQPDWAVPRHLKSYFQKAGSLADLAQKIGVDSSGLEQTVSKFNQHARQGKDPDFGKGESLFDLYYGDPNNTPNPCVAPLEKGPYYAVRIDAGDIGTKGGLLTNINAQVLSEAGEPIAGLYAIGNTAASMMAQTYPGAGSTIGPAMTFGFLAANYIQAQEEA